MLNSIVKVMYDKSPKKETNMPYDQDALTFEQMNEMLAYDPETGKICWRVKSAKKVVIGNEAGCTKTQRALADGRKVAYRYIRVMGRAMSAPRVAWLLHHGEWPRGKLLFHDGNPLNLRLANLYMSNSLATEHDFSVEGGRADYLREHRENYPMDWKDHDLRKNFDITLADYTQMAVTQGGKCAICNCEETAVRGGKAKALAVDHDHATGKIRGLLCSACNTAMGKLKDNRDILLAMIRYLDKHSGRDMTTTLTVVPTAAPTEETKQ
jgi:hypothetical protein